VLASKPHFPWEFALHAWLVLNKKGTISRWEIRHFMNKSDKSLGHLFVDHQPPFQGIGLFQFSKKNFREVQLVGSAEGDEHSLAYRVIEFVEKSKDTYPFIRRYFITGPNSNTYIKWILKAFPELGIKLSSRFIGSEVKP
jgi:hypothetical protein